MRFAASLLLLLQIAVGPNAHPRSDPSYLRYARPVLRSGDLSGQTCVVLDRDVLAHVANRGANDLRLYEPAGKGQQEVPFVLTESSAALAEPEIVPARNERVHGSNVEFDLQMPARPYSEIELHIDGSGFLARAQATGSDAERAAGQDLGTVTLFDFSSNGQALPRSTQLHLGESSFPWVHVRLQFFDVHGRSFGARRAPVVTEAAVPPSRQAQVLYTTAASTTALTSQGTNTVAELLIGAHVPAERVRIELVPQFKADFLREVTITASPRFGEAKGGEAEVFHGTIGRVTQPDPGPGLPAIRFNELTIASALGSNLRSDASVRVSIANGGAVPLPIRAVSLEMRQRSLCFEATTGTTYTLFYGDELLPAPLYDYARTFKPVTHAQRATLGPEQRNPAYVTRNDGWRARNPELFWVILLAALTLFGAALVERLRRHRP